jgi:hypothetical protein
MIITAILIVRIIAICDSGSDNDRNPESQYCED